MWIAAQYCTLDLLETTKVSQGRDVRKYVMLVASDKVQWEVVPIIKGGGRVGFLARKESARERNGTVAISVGMFS